jgi:hypothetical protein
MSIVIPMLREQLEHDTVAVISRIHHIFLASSNNTISVKKLLKSEGQYSLFKHSLVLILRANQKVCGFKRRNGQNCSPPFTSGSMEAVSSGVSHSKSLNQLVTNWSVHKINFGFVHHKHIYMIFVFVTHKFADPK